MKLKHAQCWVNWMKAKDQGVNGTFWRWARQVPSTRSSLVVPAHKWSPVPFCTSCCLSPSLSFMLLSSRTPQNVHFALARSPCHLLQATFSCQRVRLLQKGGEGPEVLLKVCIPSLVCSSLQPQPLIVLVQKHFQSGGTDLISASVGTGFGIWNPTGWVCSWLWGLPADGVGFLISTSQMLLPVQKGCCWMGNFVGFLIRFYQSLIFPW